MTEKIGSIGLGLVGSALAERFTLAGFNVIGHDIDQSRFEVLKEISIESANSPCEVAESVQRIVLSLPNSDVVEEVVEGTNGIIYGADSDTLIIDTTTGDPVRTEKLAKRLRSRGIAYIDATIAGSSQQVRSGEVILMIGGDEKIVESQHDIFDAFASEAFLMGANGKGAETKLIVNLFIGLNRLVLAEGLAMGMKAGIESEQLLKVLKSSAAYSRMMDTKSDKMITGDFTPEARLKQHFKDVGLILDMGERLNARLPLSNLHAKLLREAMETGHGDDDNSSIIKVFRE